MNKNILFQFKDPVTQAGDIVQGICYVRIQEDIPKAQIVLTFQTKEYSKVLEKRRIPYDANNPQMIPEKLVEKSTNIQFTLESPIRMQKQTQKKYELHGASLFRVIRQYGTHESFVYTQELYTGTIKTGDYKFPFQIPTQSNMCSSFYYKSEDGLKQAKCGYKITLRIDLPDEARTFMMESTDVFINSRTSTSSEQFRSCEGNIVQFLCLNRGTVELSIKLSKNTYIPGEQMVVEYVLDNTRSQRSISRVEARLINKLTFIDDDEVERVIENTQVFHYNLGGVNSGQKMERQTAKLEVPKALRASLKTNTIRNQYFLQLQAVADAFLTWLSVPVMCQVPIHIQESQMPQKPNVEGWNFVPVMNVSVNAFSNLSVQQSFIPS